MILETLAMVPKILSLVLFLALSMKALSTPLHDGVLSKRAYTCPETITDPKLGEFVLDPDQLSTSEEEDYKILNCFYVLKSDPNQQTYCSYSLENGHVYTNLDGICPKKLK